VELLTTEEFELSKTFLYKKIKKKTNLTWRETLMYPILLLKKVLRSYTIDNREMSMCAVYWRLVDYWVVSY
jgi:hypothetical protein